MTEKGSDGKGVSRLKRGQVPFWQSGQIYRLKRGQVPFWQSGNYDFRNSSFERNRDIVHCCNLLALKHLGYRTQFDAESILNSGFNIVIDYFCGDWWRKGVAPWKMDKVPGSQDLEWFNAFARGLLLGLLSERWNDVAAICRWVEPGLYSERLRHDRGGDQQILADLYICIAASLRPEPMPGLNALEAKLTRCRQLRPRLLHRAWNAVVSGDRPLFVSTLVQSLALFEAVEGYRSMPINWIAMHSSVIALAAQRSGMAPIQLPPRLEALLLTRSSLALDIDSNSANSLLTKFNKKYRKTEMPSWRQITILHRGLEKIASEKNKETRAVNDVDRAVSDVDVERWFNKRGLIAAHFRDRDQFLEYYHAVKKGKTE